MRCIKTGFYAIMPNGLFLYGDAFASGNSSYSDAAIMDTQHDLILRVKSISNETPNKIHIRLDTWHVWFEEHTAKNQIEAYCAIWNPCSTLIADAGDWQWLGYAGEEV